MDNKSPKVLLIVDSLSVEYGGPAFSVPYLCHALATYCSIDATIWSPDAANINRDDLPSNLQICSYSLYDLLLHIKDYYIVHLNSLWTPVNILVAVWCRLLGIPYVFSTRGMLAPWALRRHWLVKYIIWHTVQYRILSCASAIHVTSTIEEKEVAKLLPYAAIFCAPNAIQMPSSHFEGKVEDLGYRQALFLSRIHPKKGLDLLLRAWESVGPVGWKLAVVGSGDKAYMDKMVELARKLRICNDVIFYHKVIGDEKAKIFRSSALYILPSYSENYGIAVLEALSYGIPVITTTATPWLDLQEKGCGWIIDPNVKDLSCALIRAITQNAYEANKMKKACIAFASTQYSWEAIASIFAKEYRNLIE